MALGLLRAYSPNICIYCANRHGDGEIAKAMTDFCIKVESFYELKAPDEENTYNIEISNEMTPNDVAEKILEIVGEL